MLINPRSQCLFSHFLGGGGIASRNHYDHLLCSKSSPKNALLSSSLKSSRKESLKRFLKQTFGSLLCLNKNMFCFSTRNVLCVLEFPAQKTILFWPKSARPTGKAEPEEKKPKAAAKVRAAKDKKKQKKTTV